MQRKKKLYLSICDYSKNVVCDLYDNQSDISGQATNVCIDTERNGYKELTFDIPSTCMSEEGEIENYRLKYLIAEYYIRAVKDDETDWFIISEPRITRNAFSKNVSVKAQHISQLLKHKNLDLEFSDEEGNNVGTAGQILDIILEGTGWTAGNVGNYDPVTGEWEPFKDEDGSVKYRSITGQAGTGALSFIESLCDAFEAKPIYHGGTKKVDIVAMNPFARIEPEEIPAEILDNNLKVIELYYDRNVHNLSKTNNTDNIATRLYAYGSSGDMNGICTLQNAVHYEWTMTVSSDATDTEFCFTISNVNRYFTASVNEGDILVWSNMDITSMSYVYNKTKGYAYRVYKKPKGSFVDLTDFLSEPEEVKNNFPYLLGLKYYDDVGLMTEEQFQEVADFQRNMPETYKKAQNASENYIAKEAELSSLAENNTGMLKLKIASGPDNRNPYKFTIDVTAKNTDHGVIYRTDYDVAERRYFQWHITDKLKANGDPIKGTPSLVLFIHKTNPVTFDMTYLKQVYDSQGNPVLNDSNEPKDFVYSTGEYPSAFDVWSDKTRYDATDEVYLFCTNSMSGKLGARLGDVESVNSSLESVTQQHPVKFWDLSRVEDQTSLPPLTDNTEYQWCYTYNYSTGAEGKLYFAWADKFNDGEWHPVYLEEPSSFDNGDYYYSFKLKKLYHAESGELVEIEDKLYVVRMFESVVYLCNKRDQLYKGVYEYYDHVGQLSSGNYAVSNGYDIYWLFKAKTSSAKLQYDYMNRFVYLFASVDQEQTDNIATTQAVESTAVGYPVENDLEDIKYYHGVIDNNGVEHDDDTMYRSQMINVNETVTYAYKMKSGTKMFFYDKYLHFLEYVEATGEETYVESTLSSPTNAYFMRYMTDTPNDESYFRVDSYENKLLYNREYYTVINTTGSGELIGIIPLMTRFQTVADKAYISYLKTLQQKQEYIKTKENELADLLGEMLKDGRWQDANYISGDEKRLYDDAMYMHKQISVPETTYEFTYLDMYGIHNVHYYEEHDVEWPHVDMSYIAHLVDIESDTNCWAYIEKIHECFDKPWETSVNIDTKLTLAGKHGFTDVVARIAEVAKDMKTKQAIYDSVVNNPVNASNIEGNIVLTQTYLTGGSSSWSNDDRGNLVFESTDGSSAMMLNGRGLAIATEKTTDGVWNWRTAATGFGMTADEITAGYIAAERLETGSITTEKLSSIVGKELDIGSNVALTLYATTDGTKPAGALTTTDSKIEIAAERTQSGTTIPAHIDIATGGVLNLNGSNINVNANSAINIAGGNIIVDANSTVDIRSGDVLNLYTDGVIRIGKTGSFFTVGGDNNNAYIYSGIPKIESLSDGVYIGTNGFVLRQTKEVVVNDVTTNVTTAILAKDGDITITGSLEAVAGSIGNWQIEGTKLVSGDNNMYVGLDSDFSSQTIGDKIIYDQPYAIWCGSPSLQEEDLERAPFRVTRNGEVYLNKLMVFNGTTYDSIEFSQNFRDAISVSDTSGWDGSGNLVLHYKLFNKVDAYTVSTINVNVVTLSLVQNSYSLLTDAASFTVPLVANFDGDVDTRTVQIDNVSLAEIRTAVEGQYQPITVDEVLTSRTGKEADLLTERIIDGEAYYKLADDGADVNICTVAQNTYYVKGI